MTAISAPVSNFVADALNLIQTNLPVILTVTFTLIAIGLVIRQVRKHAK